MIDWIERWNENNIGWHQSAPNGRLTKWLPALDLAIGDTIFVPLCGKSLDMLYLLNQGFSVIGVELSQKAVEDFFKQNQLTFRMTTQADFIVYQGDNIQLYVGDFFLLNSTILTNVVGVYDRAALIALPAVLRMQYVQHLNNILPAKVVILLLTLDYPQAQKSGPPFALNATEIKTLFASDFSYQLLENIDGLSCEPKFIQAGVDYLHKTSYLLTRSKP